MFGIMKAMTICRLIFACVICSAVGLAGTCEFIADSSKAAQLCSVCRLFLLPSVVVGLT